MPFPPLSPPQAMALRQETAISVAINALVPATIIFLIGATPPRVLVGTHDILGVIVPGSGMATLLMTAIITRIVRSKVAAGTVPPLLWPRPQRGLWRFIPQWLPLRAVVYAVLAIVTLVPITFVAVALTGILPLSRGGAWVFELFYGALVGLTMTRLIVVAAMADAKET